MVIRARHVHEWRVIVLVLMAALVVMSMITICVNSEYEQDITPIVIHQSTQDDESMRRLADMAEMFIGFEYGGK